MAERHVTDFLQRVLQRHGMVRGVRRADAVLAWPKIVGPEVARFATAVAFAQGTLVVEVSDAETAMHLGLQRSRILAVYRERYPDHPVRDLRFRVGRPRPPEAPRAGEAPPPEPDLDPSELSALEVAAMAGGETMAPTAVRLARALAGWRARRRAEGWLACEVCSALTPPPTGGGRAPAPPPPIRCDTCARQMTLPKVLDAAARLSVDPGRETPALTSEERSVARWLARGRLAAHLRELMPAALANPGAREALEHAARCAIALATGGGDPNAIDLDTIDPARAGIDPRVLRILGHYPSEET
jgi:hypothetical protein